MTIDLEIDLSIDEKIEKVMRELRSNEEERKKLSIELSEKKRKLDELKYLRDLEALENEAVESVEDDIIFSKGEVLEALFAFDNNKYETQAFSIDASNILREQAEIVRAVLIKYIKDNR